MIFINFQYNLFDRRACLCADFYVSYWTEWNGKRNAKAECAVRTNSIGQSGFESNKRKKVLFFLNENYFHSMGQQATTKTKTTSSNCN